MDMGPEAKILRCEVSKKDTGNGSNKLEIASEVPFPKSLASGICVH
jgi:hypothetical protein